MSTYRVIEVIGTSTTSWEDAAAEAVKAAGLTLHDLRVGEVVKQDIHVDEAGGITFRTKLELSFKYRPSSHRGTDPGYVGGAAFSGWPMEPAGGQAASNAAAVCFTGRSVTTSTRRSSAPPAPSPAGPSDQALILLGALRPARRRNADRAQSRPPKRGIQND